MLKEKKNLRKITSLFVLLIMCISVVMLTSCGKDNHSSLVLYGEEAYEYTLVYGADREDWESDAIVRIYEGLEQMCGIAPNLVADTEVEESENGKEILIGSTKRLQSGLPELKEKDCYWCVKIDSDKIVINGSNEYMLGLAVDYFMEHWNKDGIENQVVVASDITKEVTLNDYYREGWLLKTIPAYQGDNSLAKALYDAGTYAKQYGNTRIANCMMQSIASTNAEELADYKKAMETNGYKEESHTTIEKNEFYRFTKEKQRVYVNYYANDEKAIVILDENKGVGTAEASYIYEPKEGDTTEIYMFGLKMDPNGINISDNTSGYVNNGQNMIIKCADNSVIIIDGGDDEQMAPADQERFFSLLHQITGTSEHEKIRVSAWYITHMHSDHVSGLRAVFEKNASKLNVERVICNMPNPATVYMENDIYFSETTNIILSNYPQCQDIKVHTGDVIQLADVKLSILFTHEDLAGPDAVFPTNDFNATSTVVMTETASGMRTLITGDMTVMAEDVLCKNFSTETLKCDILQQPHHNFNDNTTVYESANAQVMLFTQSRGGLVRDDDMTRRSTLAKKWCSEWYCEGSETVGFAYENGRAKLIYRVEDIYN